MKALQQAPEAPPAQQRHYWHQLNPSSASFAISRALLTSPTSSLIICPTMASADRTYSELSTMLQGEKKAPPLRQFPDWETLPYDSFSPHQDIISERLRCLYELCFTERNCVIISAQTLLQRLIPTSYLKSKSLRVELGQQIKREQFCSELTEAGYLRVDTVFQHGEFAVRGSLIDIFPMGSDEAFRLEFFDDEIDSLRRFDPESQRSTEQVKRIELLPGRECPLDSDAIAGFKERWFESFDVDHRQCPVFQDISSGLPAAGIEYYSPLFFDKLASLFSYLPDATQIYSFEGVEQAIEDHWRELSERYESRKGDLRRPILPPQQIYLPINELFGELKAFSRTVISENKAPQDKAGHFDFATSPMPQLAIETHASNPLHRLQAFLSSTNKRVLFCAESEGRREVIKEQLDKINILPDELSSLNAFFSGDSEHAICIADLGDGINSANDDFIIINENALFSGRVRQSRRRRKESDDSDNIVKNLTELKLGAPVVHIEHGVGRYRGLETISVDSQAQEYLTLEYANEAKLYVPVADLHLISRYSGADEAVAPLHKLGSEQWSKAKKKAAEQVNDVAAELLHIYALRKARKGFSHLLEGDAYERFSNEFAFEETPDQSSAIQAVRADMLSPQPMDRLVCGDVGFGKTEVAMRAAFIAVQNNKQVAVLVPTTLLAQQHFDNFKDRFANWPINIEVISRFKTGKESAEVIKRIESGNVDIVVGTHKLIMGDINFERLGLVIIDEEHRFGVKQKETLKSIRTEVDILNLTATPIPRTLNMAMSGIRDLSIIATPPAKRLSVKTFVRENDKALVKEAVLREIMRGGQVYYLHNEVKSIEKAARDLAELVPDARIQIGHGQMRERELEAVMSDFYHKRFNILVCTTIIETGIDVPSANTIIIDRADKFGLAQLHQLRGRVGRSHHQAYAYLLSPNKKNLSADAVKRLEAIEEAQDLGAGFTLASHDLEIRGAGELLGDEQSGQMHAIGFTLYMDMLDRAVKAIKKGEKVDLEKPIQLNAEINLRIPALIPDDYLPDVSLRLQLYKRLASAGSHEALEKLQVEMIDRFGLLPDALKNLFRSTGLRLRSEALGISRIEASARGGKLEFSADTKVDPLAIVKLVQNQPQNYKLVGANQLQFMQTSADADQRLKLVSGLLDTLTKASQ
ncbi:transcription-repair coupling factor [Agaribacterium haliotis]|uniref:transcription-repair coupling factor n=1 Tax=Agaribacterium haliotis TaxID=2013869 RepID=UPI000BB564EB|nr:transcription-repair coupling factor [Agaribacterium haliotis]